MILIGNLIPENVHMVKNRKILEFFKRLTSALFKKDKYELIAKYFNKSNEVFFSFIEV